MACGLHILLAAVAGGAAGVGCLVTDPVPYEPAENIPPIVLPGLEITPNPLNIKTVDIDPSIPFDQRVQSIHFSLTIVDYNLGDTLSLRRFVDDPGAERGSVTLTVPPSPTGGRERQVEFDLSVNTAPLSGVPGCHTVLLAISDRGWLDRDTPYYKVPTQDGTVDGEPVTVPALVLWWIVLDNGTTNPALEDCGVPAP